MSTQTPQIAPQRAESAHQIVMLAPRRTATWRQVLPAHRLPVVSKTPLLIALGVYFSGGSFRASTVAVTMALAAALWCDLYILNEATDLACEKDLTIPRLLLVPLYALPILLWTGAAALSWRLAIPFAGMILSQFAYCVPPLRLKRYWWANILLSGTLNPILRLQCGVVWGTHGLSALVYGAFVCAHLGAALRARVLLRERDRKFGYTVAPAGSATAGKLLTLIGFACAGLMCYRKDLPTTFIPIVASAALFSLYAWADQKTDIERLRRGWLAFALLSLIALAELFARR